METKLIQSRLIEYLVIENRLVRRRMTKEILDLRVGSSRAACCCLLIQLQWGGIKKKEINRETRKAMEGSEWKQRGQDQAEEEHAGVTR